MAANQAKLTNSRVSKLTNNAGKPLWVFDDDTPGFCVTVSPQGKKVFYYVGRVNGVPTRSRLGVFPTLTVDNARQAARVIVGDVARGVDVRLRKQQGLATLDDLWGHFFKAHSKASKRTWQRDEKEYERLIRPEFGSVKLNDISRSDVEGFVAKVEEQYGRGPARKARALLSVMFEKGIEWEWCEKNPVRKTRRPEFDPRQRYLKVDEVTAFFNAVDSLRNETAQDFFKLCVYTGQRRANVASMEWTEIDFSARIWTVPAPKAKGKLAIVVPLSELAIGVLKRRKLAQRKPQQFVLPSRSKAGHYRNPKDAWRRVMKAAGIENLRIHDLRRSLGAWQQAGGANLKTISQSLGHSSVEITAQTYSPIEVEAVRASVDGALKATFRAARRKSR